MSLGNGRTKAAVISAGCAVLVCSSVVVGWYNGWHARIEHEIIREKQIDDHLSQSADLVPRFLEVETTSRTNKENIMVLREDVKTLVQAQKETNAKLDRLTDSLMNYLASQTRRPTARQ